MTTVTISLPDPLKAFIDSQIAGGAYGNVSEYIRSLLRDAQAREREARLDSLLIEGLASQTIALDDSFRTNLETKIDSLLNRHRDRRPPG